MLRYQFIAMSVLFAAAPVEASAQTAAAAAVSPASVAPGAMLRTSDGKRAGQIFSVDKAADGTVTGVALIGPNSILIHVPISTIAATDKSHFTTSLSYKDIFR